MSKPTRLPLDRDYVPPDGMPSITEVNQRVLNASNRMQIMGKGLGAAPQMPFNTAWQVQALMRILVRAKICTLGDFFYFTTLAQCEDLERVVGEEQSAASSLVVPSIQKNGN